MSESHLGSELIGILTTWALGLSFMLDVWRFLSDFGGVLLESVIPHHFGLRTKGIWNTVTPRESGLMRTLQLIELLNV